ncbi:MAG: hypothetical protein A2X13_10210 [Bacteroidetes bacterium GWC2_33_15]|nr:MAG: hypothetical protein A2X10_02765 [Bacteroidetes bacterium GWA2_33_15]OFX48779.1 MAG: hypothetical protein A2X13_10210 [Bacteroidetes bacterium GWC2_33_15]OFX66021.1 MAG: hypothetical protein A2X15_11360 [Bacteroidetes bacterium GWB2_32_14]OFX68218.1 MAG: hypothetical protein A2X14_07535 [Bacteroidetes bacterium GWD2_33_33]HAN17994.1 hypothetical protein [Bacteroidales bacterium]
MENLYIEPTEITPKIVFDVKNKTFELSGISRPEDVVAFYESIIFKIDQYVSHLLKNESEVNKLKFDLNFDLTYINSASSKYILQILDFFKKLSLKGAIINCNWYYEDLDDQILEDGEDLSDVIRMDFNFIARI